MSDDPLREEHARLQRVVAMSRHKFAVSTDGVFARTMMAAMDEYHAARKAGMSREDACRGLEAVLRDVWPKPTTKFPPQCEACQGTGYRDMTCWHEQRCQREICHTAHPSFEHGYVVTCECTAGDKFRPVSQQPDDVVAAAGRMPRKRKPQGWSRV